jgi:hypothetical protein
MALHHTLRSGPASESGAQPPPGGEPGHADAVEVYRRTYTTLLRSTGETKLKVLEASHKAMGSSLHPLGGEGDLDLGAFLYSIRRLPTAISDAELVVMGQSTEVFARQGFGLDAAPWIAVDAPGRRRRWYHDDAGTLAVLIASASDVDDLIPTLVAYQIEWNKLGERLRSAGLPRPGVAPSAAECAAVLGGDEHDWEQLAEVWGDGFAAELETVAARHMSLRMRMLGGTQVGYARVTRRWWAPVLRLLDEQGLANRPVYFVSSNAHSIVNLATGTVAGREQPIVDFVEREGPEELRIELQRFRQGRSSGDWNNFLYYAARLFYKAQPPDSAEHAHRRAHEQSQGVFHIGSDTALDVAAQVIALERLNPVHFDPRLGQIELDALRRSRALVVNIDYPLGLSAYNILREVAETVGELRGVYVLGKAATLNADVGDVMISGVVHDEHSGSTYWLDNAFSVDDIAPHLRFGSGLDNQRAVTVKGTFLQNRGYLDFYYREAFTVVEMEAGPYCAAVYEMTTAQRFPTGEPVNFSKLPLDFGIIHYASDTPFTQARTLGARGLSYHGMDSTYASSIAILRRILKLEGALAETAPV